MFMSLKGLKMSVIGFFSEIIAGLLSFVVARPYKCYSKYFSSEKISLNVSVREMRDMKCTYFLLD